jgi:hypothetical protein
MIAYAFLIPIIPQLYEISLTNVSESEINELTKRLVSFGGITISGVVARELIKKIINRFKS